VAVRRPIRGHPTLAPAHLGEAASAAAVVIVVGGIACVILGAAMLVSGLTIGSRYTDGSPPPHLATLGTGPVLGGIGILVLGIAMLMSGLATIADVRGTRRLSAILSLVAAGLAAAGVVLAMLTPPPDVIIAIALAIATLAFGVSGIVLLRPRRAD
jgi:MFS-type transporter involved in bile tolerance (Atg22 family)